MAAAESDDTLVNIDGLDLEDKLKWLKEILENGRERFGHIDPIGKLADFTEKLAEEKIISGFNKKNIDAKKENSEKIEELHRILPTKGWENFKKARSILYDMFPEFQEDGIWDEGQIDNLPVLSIKYCSTNDDVTGVEHDGAVAVGASADAVADTTPTEVPDGMFSSSNKESSEPAKSISTRQEFSALPAYSMSKRRNKGMCLIVNNENYQKARDAGRIYKNRNGSSVDAQSLKEMFGKLGFYVEYQKNLTKPKLDKLINMIVEFNNLNTYCCFVAVFLSHGENESLSCVDGQEKKIDDIINAFKGDNCPALNGIPKWFIVQACRGNNFNMEVQVQHDAPGDEGQDIQRQSDKPISIPSCADFYISYATAPGYYSFRNINEGSWFINDLCNVLKQYAEREDVNTMMTRVNRNVALGRVVTSEMGYRRQMPCHVNMLTSALYLCSVRHSQF